MGRNRRASRRRSSSSTSIWSGCCSSSSLISLAAARVAESWRSRCSKVSRRDGAAVGLATVVWGAAALVDAWPSLARCYRAHAPPWPPWPHCRLLAPEVRPCRDAAAVLLVLLCCCYAAWVAASRCASPTVAVVAAAHAVHATASTGLGYCCPAMPVLAILARFLLCASVHVIMLASHSCVFMYASLAHCWKPKDDQDEDQDHLDQAFQEDYHV
ncbi:hypothetical protein QYE76_059103 [Lolium multiflorum]|uniref:Uncharacterized protein n=1 Tax=Lolium multiflorum TaxID=4521 RepID=A0AAD8WQA6_LOLMU|nr:hypothetical protein QYE76_059103 [Lolium multiflorum]